MPSQISKVTPADFDDAWQLLEEYFDFGQVVVRDARSSLSGCSADGRNCLWLARVDGLPAGCIALRRLSEDAGEVKRLFVRAAFRRQGLAAGLLAALEEHAVAVGLQWLYLDSKDDFKDAIAFYQNSGYRFCERYNDNPQATVFLRKELAL